MEKVQRDYLSAIKTTSTILIYGHYESKPKSCFSCDRTQNDIEEKMTDLNIAVHMPTDAVDDIL